MTNEEFDLKMRALVMQKEFTKFEKSICWLTRFVDQHFWLLLALEIVVVLWLFMEIKR